MLRRLEETYLSKGASMLDAAGSSSYSLIYDSQAGTVGEWAEAAYQKELQEDLKTPLTLVAAHVILLFVADSKA